MAQMAGRHIRRLSVALLAALGAGSSGCSGSSPSSSPSLTARTAYVLDPIGGGTLIPIDLATKTTGTPIKVSLVVAEDSIAVSPSGTTVYVAGLTFSTNPVLVPVRITTGAVGNPISLPVPNGNPPGAIAIAPNGQTAYVLGSSSSMAPLLIPVDLIHNVTRAPISLPLAEYVTMGITPDSSTAYVSSHSSISPIDLRTNGLESAIDLGGVSSGHIALSPNGQRAYVTWRNAGGQYYLVTIDLVTHGMESVALLPGSPHLISISPDGSTAYVADESGPPNVRDAVLIPVDLTKGQLGRQITLPFTTVACLAITPNGQDAYVSGMGSPYTATAGEGVSAKVVDAGAGVVPVDLATGVVGGLIPMSAAAQIGPGAIVFAS